MIKRFWMVAAGALALAGAGAASADTYGNTSPFEIQSSHSPNYVLGVQVSVPVDDFELLSFGMMYGHENGGGVGQSNALFALYSSGSDGLPASLVAATGETFLSAQQTYDNIAFTTNPVIDSGTYWMMAMYESSASPRMSVLDGGSLVAYWSNSYSNGMPANSPGNIVYYGQNFNYWVNGQVVPATSALAAVGMAAGLSALRRRR